MTRRRTGKQLIGWGTHWEQGKERNEATYRLGVKGEAVHDQKNRQKTKNTISRLKKIQMQTQNHSVLHSLDNLSDILTPVQSRKQIFSITKKNETIRVKGLRKNQPETHSQNNLVIKHS